MSNANYVPNSSNTSQQYEALGPDGTKVTNGPESNNNDKQLGPSRWKLGTSLKLPAFKYLPIHPTLHAVPGTAKTHAPHFLQPPLTTANNPMADRVLGYDRGPQVPETSDAFLRSLMTTQIWQDNVLRRKSEN
jgi:hypothetical protein